MRDPVGVRHEALADEARRRYAVVAPVTRATDRSAMTIEPHRDGTAAIRWVRRSAEERDGITWTSAPAAVGRVWEHVVGAPPQRLETAALTDDGRGRLPPRPSPRSNPEAAWLPCPGPSGIACNAENTATASEAAGPVVDRFDGDSGLKPHFWVSWGSFGQNLRRIRSGESCCSASDEKTRESRNARSGTTDRSLRSRGTHAHPASRSIACAGLGATAPPLDPPLPATRVEPVETRLGTHSRFPRRGSSPSRPSATALPSCSATPPASAWGLPRSVA